MQVLLAWRIAVGHVGPFRTLSSYDCHPAGQHAAVGPMGPFMMLSSSDCRPVGPAGPYVAGGPVGPDDLF